MDLKGILSISGYSGLFKLIKQTKTGFIVESLTDKKRMQAFASSKISTLEDIAIYTVEGEEHLKELFKKIFEYTNQQKAISYKSSNDELKEFFELVLPDFDKERVYVSDIKKVINWYNLLFDLEMMIFDEEQTDETEKEENAEEKESDNNKQEDLN